MSIVFQINSDSTVAQTNNNNKIMKTLPALCERENIGRPIGIIRRLTNYPIGIIRDLIAYSVNKGLNCLISLFFNYPFAHDLHLLHGKKGLKCLSSVLH